MSENKHLPLKLAAPARLETADGWSINVRWARHGDDDPYAGAEAFAPVLVDMVNSYASSQAEIERLRTALQGAIGALEFSRDYHSDLGNEEQAFAQDRLDAALSALSGSKE